MTEPLARVWWKPFPWKKWSPITTPPEPHSVLVWVDDLGVAHARDGKTGKIIAEGSDHAAVLQAAIDAVDKGEVVVRGTVTLASPIRMKSWVKVKFEEVAITADTYGFVFDGTKGAVLEGGRIVVTASSYTHAPILLTGTDCRLNRIRDVAIELPLWQGCGVHIVAGADQYIFMNKFEHVYILHGNEGVRVDLTGDGWCDVNEFFHVYIDTPAKNGFAVYNRGWGYAGNFHAFVTVEVNLQSNVNAFYFLITGDTVNDNTYVACKAVDAGENCYFAFRDPSSTRYTTNNVFIGCQGSGLLPDTSDFFYDIWIDYYNWQTRNYYSINVYEQAIKPVRPNTNTILHLIPSGTASGVGTGIIIDNLAAEANEFMEIKAVGDAFRVNTYARSGFTPRPLKFMTFNANVGEVEVARMDVDAIFKFYRMAVPTSAPPNPVAGSLYFDPSAGKLYVYDGTVWKSVTLT
jgi:hypothetical protein